MVVSCYIYSGVNNILKASFTASRTASIQNYTTAKNIYSTLHENNKSEITMSNRVKQSIEEVSKQYLYHTTIHTQNTLILTTHKAVQY